MGSAASADSVAWRRVSESPEARSNRPVADRMDRRQPFARSKGLPESQAGRDDSRRAPSRLCPARPRRGCERAAKGDNLEDRNGMRILTQIFPVAGPWPGRLAISARPRGGDWLHEEMSAWREAGVNVVASLLTEGEADEMELENEQAESEKNGMEFASFA